MNKKIACCKEIYEMFNILNKIWLEKIQVSNLIMVNFLFGHKHWSVNARAGKYISKCYFGFN